MNCGTIKEANYYDLDSILVEDERIKCTFTTNAIDCGFLDSSCQSQDLEKYSKVELPFWLANVLGNRGDITIQLPVFLNAKFKRFIEAGPAAVNLRDRSQYFFSLGRKIALLVSQTETDYSSSHGKKEIDQLLLIGFVGERYQLLLDHSMNCKDEDTTEFTRSLTNLEKLLFEKGLEGATDFFKWKTRQMEIIDSVSFVDKPSKRRRVKYHIPKQVDSSVGN